MFENLSKSLIFYQNCIAVSLQDISQVPFPAVTICYPKSLMYPALVDTMGSVHQDGTKETLKTMDACMQWTHKNYYFPRITNLAALKQKIRWQWSSQANESYLDTFDKLLQYLNKDYQNTLGQKYNFIVFCRFGCGSLT